MSDDVKEIRNSSRGDESNEYMQCASISNKNELTLIVTSSKQNITSTHVNTPSFLPLVMILLESNSHFSVIECIEHVGKQFSLLPTPCTFLPPR